MDPKIKWRAIKDLLHPGTCQTIGTLDEDKSRATRSATFFHDKVIAIKAAISLKLYGVTPDPLRDDKPFHGHALLNLLPVTEEEVLKLLSSLSGKSSPRDFIPTSLLKHCGAAFAAIIVRLTNLTFSEGTFPTGLKTAQVTPLLKKVGMDTGDPSNHRPISNLNTMSKVLERVFISRLMPHVSGNFCPLQSAYRQHHSTETALLRITNDLVEAVDAKKANVLGRLGSVGGV